MADHDSSTSTMIVALVAIVVIIALGFILYRGMPRGSTTPGTGTDVQLNVPTTSGGGTGQ
ncbi:MAG TPA: hypothetical protein VHA78_01360 [Candidatus Peribacteraceae bacterium]|nr:hypothetical protein [Candidatus Peribacteraceae bacterium]